MKIDIFAHILPEKYLAALGKKVDLSDKNRLKCHVMGSQATMDLQMRLKLMDRYPDVLQVVNVSLPPLDGLVTPGDALELCRIANDELAELLAKHPDKFIAAVACLPTDDMDAALAETDRAITQLGLKGVQLFARVNGEQLDHPKFRALYEKMAKYDLPIWIHPCSDDLLFEPVFGWPFATASAMRRIVAAGIFNDFPDIKFITHHCGAMAPYFEGRVKWLFPLGFEIGHPARNWAGHFRKFYNDTATYGNTAALMCAHAYFGSDRLLFGSDAPLGPKFGLTSETIESINRMDIPETDREKIFSRNAVNLLRMAI